MAIQNAYKATASPDETLKRWKLSKFETLYRQSWLFRWQLNEAEASSPLPVFIDPWRGNPQNGALIAQGSLPYPLGSDTFSRFDWIRDLRDYGGSRARMTARALILRWLDDYKNWSFVQWRPDLIAIRLTNLALTYGWFGQSADEDFQTGLKQMMKAQFRCLSLDWQRIASPFDQIVALSGLVMSQVALNVPLQTQKGTKDITALIDLIVPKVKSQLNPDGGHRSRRPERPLALLRLMLECRVAMAQIGIADRPDLAEITLRMAAITKMWRHGTGELPIFIMQAVSQHKISSRLLPDARSKDGSRLLLRIRVLCVFQQPAVW